MTPDNSAPVPGTVPLGGGPRVGIQGPGRTGVGFACGPADADGARATPERALDLGVTLSGTADMYGEGENESFLSPLFRAHRDGITVATESAVRLDPDEPLKRIIRNARPRIRQAVGAGLRRPAIDETDLYSMHRRDPGVPVEETAGALAELVQEGKVRHLGPSGVTGAELRAAHAAHPTAGAGRAAA